MKNDIKPGDLVFLKACPGREASKFSGQVRTVGRPADLHPGCFALIPPTIHDDGAHIYWHPFHLQKIDPPATGDSLPTRANKPMAMPA